MIHGQSILKAIVLLLMAFQRFTQQCRPFFGKKKIFFFWKKKIFFFWRKKKIFFIPEEEDARCAVGGLI